MKVAFNIMKWKNLVTSVGKFQRNRCIWARENHRKHIFISWNASDLRFKEFHNQKTVSDSTDHRWNFSSAIVIVGGCSLAYILFKLQLNSASLDSKAVNEAGSEKPGLPVYTSDEVSSHDNLEKGVWVTYRNGVYNISDFIHKHPGGDVILMAAGGSLEPFWEIYATHKTDMVLKILEEHRIGNLSESDRGSATDNINDPYANDPKRHPALKPASMKPFNAEPPLSLLVESFLTPNALFYVRNHLPVPDIDPNEYELEICGHGMKDMTLTLKDLKTKFPKVTVTSTVQCAGNRRSELNRVKEVKGLDWGAAAIGTATWSGARLVDILKYAKANMNDPRVQHIQFEGLDMDPANVPYGASIPVDKGFDPKADVIIAYEMNGEALPRDHGFPVRAIIPGVVGARNVKWLGRIVLSDEESHSHWQRRDYKGFSPNVEFGNVDFSTAPAIQELPVTSAICDPVSGSAPKIIDGNIKTRGYAWSGGGRKIIRVDVSANGGQTWTTAKLQQENSPLSRTWSWSLWEAEVPVPDARKNKEFELICKAVDSSYNVQPDTCPPIWNVRGVLSNAWHRIKVKLP